MKSAYDQLEDLERVFVDSLLSDLSLNSAKATRRVEDYMQQVAVDGNKIKNAPHHIKKMLERPIVQAAIAERVEEFSRETNVDAKRLIAELWNIATSTLEGIFNPSMRHPGFLEIDVNAISPAQWATISTIECRADPATGAPVIKVKLHDKLGAIDKMMKFLGMFELDNRQKLVAAITEEQKPTVFTRETSIEEAAEAYARQVRGG